MAIRKDLDDMLNSLMDGGGSSGSTPARSHNTPRAARKSKFDDMSVDDLLHALEEEKHHIEEQPVVHDDTPPAVWEFAPPSQDIPVPESVSEAEPEEVPNIIDEVMHTEASAEATRVFDTVPMNEELPKPVKKKKIVITGELPDYEALRREEQERERQARLAAENAAEEQRAAERARRAAEAAAERQRLAEEAEQRRLAREAEEAERQRRLAEAAEQARLEEEAERQRRIAQIEAEKQRKAEEMAMQARLAEEAEQRRLAEEAEKQRQAEEMRRLAEEAEKSAPVSLAEEIIVNSSAAENEVDSAIEALGEAAEAPAETAEEAAPEAEKTSKIGGFFKKLKNKGKDDEKPETEAETAPEEGLFESDDSAVSATDLIDAAIAAINHPEDAAPDNYSDPVGSMLDNIREDAAEAIADINTPKSAEPLVLTDEDIINGLTPDLKERFDALSPDKQRQVIDMRRSQMGAVAPEAAEEGYQRSYQHRGLVRDRGDCRGNCRRTRKG